MMLHTHPWCRRCYRRHHTHLAAWLLSLLFLITYTSALIAGVLVKMIDRVTGGTR